MAVLRGFGKSELLLPLQFNLLIENSIFGNKNKVMESITIYPKNEKQKSLLKSLLEEMKVKFEISTTKEDSFMSEKDFYAKIDRSILQAKEGKTKTLSKDQQKDFLGL